MPDRQVVFFQVRIESGYSGEHWLLLKSARFRLLAFASAQLPIPNCASSGSDPYEHVLDAIDKHEFVKAPCLNAMVKDGVRSNGLLENVHSTGRVVLSILTKSRLVDDVYPESDPHPGISYGSRVGAFDFYYAGIMVILGIESGVIENGCSYAGNMPWASTACNADFDRERFREIQIWKLGLIPVLNIRHYDLHGDEYNNSPYLYCTFDIDGMPYESFEYRIVGRDEYDWPLNPELQLREEAVRPQPSQSQT